MSVRAASLFGIVLSCLLFPTASLAQIAPANTTYTVHGIVVNSVTGEPVPRVLVQISSDRQHSVLTGADGKFEFTNIAGGIMNVGLQKPGYFAEQAIRVRRGHSTLIHVGPDQSVAVIKMIPEAVITGHVLGDGGEPAESLPVQVFAEQMQNGRKTWNPIRNAQTDDQGEFRFAELEPGRYYIFAGPSSWPAAFTPRARIQARAGMRALGGGPLLARGYPGAFYPAAEDRESATPVVVKAGQHVEINFNVASQIFHTISGTVSGYSSANQGLSLTATNAAGRQLGADLNFDQERGTFRTQWLPPGRYTLSAETRDNEGHAFFASQDVNLASDLTGVHLQLLPGATIPVHFQLEKTRSDSPDVGVTVQTRRGPRGTIRREGYEPARVMLTPIESTSGNGQRQFSSQLGEQENAGSEIAGVPPGTYSLQVYPNGPYYVQSARCGLVNLLLQNLTLGAGASAEPIEIALRDDYGHLLGSVRVPPDSDSAMVIAIPDADGQRVLNTPTSSPPLEAGGGKSAVTFALSPLAPGRYRVLAVDHADEFEYADPELLRKYADKGREITIASNETAKIELELVHVEE